MTGDVDDGAVWSAHLDLLVSAFDVVGRHRDARGGAAVRPAEVSGRPPRRCWSRRWGRSGVLARPHERWGKLTQAGVELTLMVRVTRLPWPVLVLEWAGTCFQGAAESRVAMSCDIAE